MKYGKKSEDAAWRKKYEAHIRSAQWKQMRKALFTMRGELCEGCGYGSATLQIHHLTYERLGNERFADLKILCRRCHAEADFDRAAEVEEKRKERQIEFELENLNKAFYTWCIKRGSDPTMGYDRDWEAFTDWRYSQRDGDWRLC